MRKGCGCMPRSTLLWMFRRRAAWLTSDSGSLAKINGRACSSQSTSAPAPSPSSTHLVTANSQSTGAFSNSSNSSCRSVTIGNRVGGKGMGELAACCQTRPPLPPVTSDVSLPSDQLTTRYGAHVLGSCEKATPARTTLVSIGWMSTSSVWFTSP